MEYPSRKALRRQEIKAREATLCARCNRKRLKRILGNRIISPEGLLMGFVAGAIAGIVTGRPPRTPDSGKMNTSVSGLILPLLHILFARSKETLARDWDDEV